MKSIIFNLLVIFVISSHNYARGDDRVGNGGDVVVCGNKVELLDIYEAKLNNIKLRTFKNSEHSEMVKEVLQTIFKDINPNKSQVYLSNFKDMPNELRMISNIHLNDVDDAGVVMIPTGCTLEQIVIQLSEEDRPSDGYRYTFSKDLWDRLDEYNKMALLLHELIYRDAIENKRVGGMVVRSIVGQLLNNKMDLIKYLTSYYKLGNYIEYKANTWKEIAITKNRLLDITMDRNEYEEEILIINMVNKSVYQVRKSDGKISNYRTEDSSNWIPLLFRKNIITYLSQIVGVIPLEEFSINKGRATKFEKPVSNISFKKQDGKSFLSLNIVRVIDFEVSDKGNLHVSGSFDFDFPGLEPNKDNYYFITFNDKYEINSIAIDNNNYARYNSSFGGGFHCKSFYLNIFSNYFLLDDICEESKDSFNLKVILDKRELAFRFMFDPNFSKLQPPYKLPFNGVIDLRVVEELDRYKIPVKLTKEVYIGKESGLFKKDVVLPPGKYSITTYTKTLLIHGNNRFYHLNKDGSVKIYE